MGRARDGKVVAHGGHRALGEESQAVIHHVLRAQQVLVTGGDQATTGI